ncbi:MAG: SspB family protein [Bauldia sp.]
MAEDQIRYDILAQDALRGVLRKVLSEVAKAGLPGDHHFYVTFATKAPGVRVSSRLLSQYPSDMTIVLQHQFWDLAVTEHAFEVGLSFNGVSERLLIPFSAVKAFVDPSVQFALQFEPAMAPVDAGDETPAPASVPIAGRKAEIVAAPAAAKAKAVKEEPAAAPAAEKPQGDAQVVSLDAFRKKN